MVGDSVMTYLVHFVDLKVTPTLTLRMTISFLSSTRGSVNGLVYPASAQLLIERDAFLSMSNYTGKSKPIKS